MSEFTTTIFGFRMPKHIAQMSKAEMLFKINGIKAGEWKCPNCEHTIDEQDYPSTVCANCGLRTIPMRCNTKGCTEVCLPTTYDDANGKRHYYDPPMLCERCTKQRSRIGRSEWCERTFPEHIYQSAMAYDRNNEARATLDAHFAWWIAEDKLGKVSGTKFVYVYGKPGIGKTIGVLAHLMRGHVAGMVDTLWYVTAYDVENMARGTYSDDTEHKTHSAMSFAKCQTTDLLVVDNAGDRANVAPSVRSAFERIIGDRLNRLAPTVIVSSRMPSKTRDGMYRCLDWIGESIATRFSRTGTLVEVA